MGQYPSASQVAEQIGVTPSTIYLWVNESPPRIAHERTVTPGGKTKYRFPAEAVAVYLGLYQDGMIEDDVPPPVPRRVRGPSRGRRVVNGVVIPDVLSKYGLD
jgi:hypothetical protein